MEHSFQADENMDLANTHISIQNNDIRHNNMREKMNAKFMY